MLVEDERTVIGLFHDRANIGVRLNEIFRSEFFLSLERTLLPPSSIPCHHCGNSRKCAPDVLQVCRAQKINSPIRVSVLQCRDSWNRLNEIPESGQLDHEYALCHRTRSRRLPWQEPLPFRQLPRQVAPVRHNLGQPCKEHHIPCERLQFAHPVTGHW